jgi:3-hydroxyisobutyrate dehydrogenase-like beta-hydroxyacid dehydrogenase
VKAIRATMRARQSEGTGMSDVTVLGLGSMGAALAQAFLKAGRAVTVWNRTPEKTQPLVAAGATAAGDVATALRASPLAVICVHDYAATRALLADAAAQAALPGRTLVQLSSGTPQEARALDPWITAAGATYLDGAILGGPQKIGLPDCLILCSGPAAAFERHAPVLRALAGDLRLVGDGIGVAAALDLAWLSMLFGMFGGVAHGARLCQSEGIGGDLYSSTFPNVPQAKWTAEVIERDAFANPGATLAVWRAALALIQRQGTEARINTEVPDFAAGLLDRAIKAGHGQEHVAAIAKVLD